MAGRSKEKSLDKAAAYHYRMRLNLDAMEVDPVDMGAMQFSRHFILFGCSVVLSVTACDPLSEDELRDFEAREFESNEQQALLETAAEWNSVDGAIELVKSSESPEGEEGTITDWIELKRNAIEGDVMFPRWDGRRLGSHRFEVRYTHTVIDYDYNIAKSGYAWEADTMLKVIDGPTPLDPEELDPRPRRGALGETSEESLEDLDLE